jgi:TP901 family phage tail tape measure protein
MTRIGITGENASPDEVDKGLIRMRDLALETAQPISALKDGMASLTSAGQSFTESLAMLPAIARTAQASGATTTDIANSSLAIIRHLKVETKDLQKAQDMITRGGELGQFELKDMARYLPSMAPAAKAVGFEGTKGLAQMVAMLQVIREGTGTAEEAASSANNIFAKMESEETSKKFKKMGVDLRKEMESARKNGDNLIDTFVKLTDKALKGDMSKLPQLFTDMEFARGMRALLAGYAKMPDLVAKINDSQGAVANNLKRITGDSQAALDRVSESSDRARQALGGLVAELAKDNIANAAGSFQTIAEALERMRAAAKDGGAVAAITQAAGDYWSALKKDLSGRDAAMNSPDDMLRVAEDNATLSRMRTRNVDEHPEARGLRNTIQMLENVPKRTPAQYAALQRHKARLSQVAPKLEPNADELAALSRQIGRDGGGTFRGADLAPLESYKEQQLELLREGNRARSRMSPSPSALPVPPVRQTPAVSFSDVPMQGFDEAGKKAEAIKEAVEGIGPAGQSASASLGQSFTSTADRIISDIDRVQQRLNTLRLPNLGTMSGFPTGRSMSEAE